MSAVHPAWFRSIVFSKDFPREVCAPNERPVDSISRYEKAENAYCLRNGILRGGGGQ